jgi:hypothetical protein
MVICWPRNWATMRGFKWRIFSARSPRSSLLINPLMTELLPAPSGPRKTIFSLNSSFT